MGESVLSGDMLALTELKSRHLAHLAALEVGVVAEGALGAGPLVPLTAHRDRVCPSGGCGAQVSHN